MELEAIRKFVQDHPDGVVIHMVTGEKLRVPHRDFISLGAPKEMLSGRQIVKGSSFVFFETGEVASMRLLNALLVESIVPLKRNGNGSHAKRKSRKGR